MREERIIGGAFQDEGGVNPVRGECREARDIRPMVTGNCRLQVLTTWSASGRARHGCLRTHLIASDEIFAATACSHGKAVLVEYPSDLLYEKAACSTTRDHESFV